MSIILHRPTTQEIESCKLNDGNPQLFLAGPILGARDWQGVGVRALEHVLPDDIDVHVSNPRWDTIPPQEKFPQTDQRSWEKRHYRAALNAGKWGTRGVMLFFIDSESHQAPTPNPPNRAYAQGTRSEFSEAVGAHLFADHQVDIVLGMSAAHDAHGHGLFEYRHTAEELGLKIHLGLPDTLRAAAELLVAPPSPGRSTHIG
jgi:hypothetical protein